MDTILEQLVSVNIDLDKILQSIQVIRRNTELVPEMIQSIEDALSFNPEEREPAWDDPMWEEQGFGCLELKDA